MTSRQIGRTAVATAAAVLILSSGCDFDGVTQVARAPAERADLALVIRADSLSEAAELLGWGEAIPDAEVALSWADSDEEPLRVSTDAEGTARFENIRVGSYRLSVSRPLTAEELATVEDTEVTGVFDDFAIAVQGPTEEQELTPLPSLRRGLIISEYYFNPFHRAGVGTYQTGGFLELYNNGDTTIYLDRKLIGRGLSLVSDATPCDWTARFRTDPGGVWAMEIQRFPGSGHDHPLDPGETAVIATDAIDHSAFIDELLDLSGADFEMSGPQAPDNPAVPNLVDIGPWSNPLGHGILFHGLAGIAFLADAVDLDGLPRDRVAPESNFEMQRIPSDDILDVAAFASTYPPRVGRWCDPFVHRRFDRREGYHLLHGEGAWLTSVNRKVAGVLPDGRKVLQHTRSSDTDFAVGERTPGWIP